jgi:hypothetical protein
VGARNPLQGIPASAGDSSLPQADLFTEVGRTSDGRTVLMPKGDERRAREAWDLAIEAARGSGIVDLVRDGLICGTHITTHAAEDGNEVIVILFAWNIPTEREARAVASSIQKDLKAIRPILDAHSAAIYPTNMMSAYLSDMADQGVPEHRFMDAPYGQFGFYTDQFAVGLRILHEPEAYWLRHHVTFRDWAVIGILEGFYETGSHNHHLVTGENTLTVYEDYRDRLVEEVTDDIAEGLAS